MGFFKAILFRASSLRSHDTLARYLFLVGEVPYSSSIHPKYNTVDGCEILHHHFSIVDGWNPVNHGINIWINHQLLQGAPFFSAAQWPDWDALSGGPRRPSFPVSASGSSGHGSHAYSCIYIYTYIKGKSWTYHGDIIMTYLSKYIYIYIFIDVYIDVYLDTSLDVLGLGLQLWWKKWWPYLQNLRIVGTWAPGCPMQGLVATGSAKIDETSREARRSSGCSHKPQ